MAQQRRSSAQSVLHPDRLWFWEKAVYLDENQHAWLPIIMELYPEGQYRCSDSSYWRIVYHVKFNNTEDMLLELLPGSRQK